MFAMMNNGGDWRYYDDDGSPALVVSDEDKPDYYMMYGTKYYSYGGVKRIVSKIARPLQTTQKALLERIGQCDKVAPNPRYTERYPMKLFRCDRIDALIPF